MSLGTTLWLRIMLILLVGIVSLQLLMLSALPLIPGEPRPSQLPRPAQVAAIVHLLEATPAERRAALLPLLNDSFYTVSLVPPAPAETSAKSGSPLEQDYVVALPGRSVQVSGGQFADLGI